MNKVYTDNGSWWVDELTDICYFKSKSIETQQENYEFMTWTRNTDLSNYSKNPIRMYDIEFEEKKYFFLAYEENGRYKIQVENTYEFDELCKKKNISIIAEQKNLN